MGAACSDTACLDAACLGSFFLLGIVKREWLFARLVPTAEEISLSVDMPPATGKLLH